MSNIYRNTHKASALATDISFLAESGPAARDNRKLKGAARYAAKRARLDSLRNGRRA